LTLHERAVLELDQFSDPEDLPRNRLKPLAGNDILYGSDTQFNNANGNVKADFEIGLTGHQLLNGAVDFDL
jgi:hypothetical protein